MASGSVVESLGGVWSLDTWRAVFVQADTLSSGPFQASGTEASPVHLGDNEWLPQSMGGLAGTGSDDFPLLDSTYPLMMVSLYVLGTPLLTRLARGMGLDGTSGLFRVLAFLHNIVLLAYSAWACVRVLTLLVRSFYERGYWNTYCDTDGEIGNQIAAHTFLNYLSKAYEFLDTAVLIVRRKNVSWLQSYHHTGIIIVMWTCSVTRHPHSSFMVGINAFVHSVMYGYFLLTELPVDRRNFAFVRPWITTVQIFQFLMGLNVALPAALGLAGYWGKPLGQPADDMAACLDHAQAQAATFAFAYLSPLLLLFINFFARNYIFKSSSSGARTPATDAKKDA